MRTWLNNHFGISKGEFNGLLVLIVLIMLLKASPLVFEHFASPVADDPNLVLQIQKIEISDQETERHFKNFKAGVSGKESKLFKFDPNTIGLTAWQSLGLSPKQAQSILNYIGKGGRFYKPEDLQKMYTISAKMYERVYPYIEIAESEKGYPKKEFSYGKKVFVKKAPVLIDLNVADSAQLDEVKGIGPAFALRILKYRERLGGFYQKEQLMEVYGLDSLKYAEIEGQITISTSNLRKVNINTGTFNDLKGNPYLSYKQINAILQYRKQHGNYSSIADLKKVAILNPQIIEKIAPYLSF